MYRMTIMFEFESEDQAVVFVRKHISKVMNDSLDGLLHYLVFIPQGGTQ